MYVKFPQPRSCLTCTPSDTVAQTAEQGLWVGGAGNITGRLRNDVADTVWSGIAAGTYLPGDWTLIKATGTTATLIICLRDPVVG